ncbi:hypothetical protein BLNAU_7482 [Blattamonas nauphoetae]|uniref:DUF4371 domain-containing protein n=1 Tax=Blattamonas nauphoetae TaxID=2049346 RepID=A0ABQ9Y1G3_9EUKA|nr:hypothetical protein BLNAU_7482 [Blattamonas nauphoetae]
MNQKTTIIPNNEDDVEWDLELAYAGSVIEEEDLRVDIARWSSWPKFIHPHRNESFFQLQPGTGVLWVICVAYWASHLSNSVPYITIPAFPPTATHLQRHIERKRHNIALQYLDHHTSLNHSPSLPLSEYFAHVRSRLIWTHFIAKKMVANHLFPDIISRMDQCNQLSKTTFPPLTSPDSFYKLITVLDRYYHNSTLDRVRQYGFFSVMLDTSQDRTLTKQLSAIFEFCSENGLVETFLLGLVPILARATGQLHHQTLMALLQQNGQSIANCVGIGFDGDNVNVGKNKELLVHARKDNTNLLGYHCAAHRGQLAIQDFYKTLTIMIFLS